MFVSLIHRSTRWGRLTLAVGIAAVVVPAAGIGSRAAAAVPAAGPPSRSLVAAAPRPARSQTQVRTNWVAFFNGKTPTARRIRLLQDGQEFAAVLKAASASPLAAGVSARVTKVTITSRTRARVKYSLVAGGAPVLPNQNGTAIYQKGIWKVGDGSFCSLLSLEAGGKKASLPAACGHKK